MGQELELHKAFKFESAVMIQAFIISNSEEVTDFLHGTTAGDLQVLLQMSYNEFELSIIMLAKRYSDSVQAGSKFKSLPFMTQSLLAKMVDTFPHEKLRLSKD